jgi:hypothetical protein
MTGRKEEADYIGFIKKLPCCVTGAHGVEGAHVSTANVKHGHFGRAKQSKASDRWVLPLSPGQHRLQHSMNEMEYWKSKGINPHELALSLHGIFTELGDCMEAESAALKAIQEHRK